MSTKLIHRARLSRNPIAALLIATMFVFTIFAASAERATAQQNPNCPRLLAGVVGLTAGFAAQAVAAYVTCKEDPLSNACFTAGTAVVQLGLQFWQAYQTWCALCAPQMALCGGNGGANPPPAPPEIPKPEPPVVLPPPVVPPPMPPPMPPMP